MAEQERPREQPIQAEAKQQEAAKKEDPSLQRYNLTYHNLDKFNSQFQSNPETKPQEVDQES
jgi:hypothetical protein